MMSYLHSLRDILNLGYHKSNRTGIDTISYFGMQFRYNMEEGFPILTTKKINFDAVKGELLGFIQGFDSAAQFRDMGVNIWNANANENKDWLDNPNRLGEDDLGRIYGVQWREWRVPQFKRDGSFNRNGQRSWLDQLATAINQIRETPESRRIIVSAWNPAELDMMALPPCHMMFQLNVRGEYLDLQMYQRSCDFFLGVPFNISSYALLLHMIAQVTNLKAGEFIHTLGDAHIYENHLTQVVLQMGRDPFPLPKLWLNPRIREIDDFELDDIKIENYQHHPFIKAEMAI